MGEKLVFIRSRDQCSAKRKKNKKALPVRWGIGLGYDLRYWLGSGLGPGFGSEITMRTPRAYSGFSRDLLIIFPYVGVFSQWLLPELLMKSNKPHCIRKTIVWGSYWYKVCCLTSITKIVMPKIARKIEKKCQILRQLFRLWTVVAQCWYTILKFHGKIGICEKIPYQTV